MAAEIVLSGIDHPHTLDFVFDRPHGIGRWMITCFATPFAVMIDGRLEIGKAGDCLINDPLSPQFHGSAPNAVEGFRNDWLFTESDEVAARIAELDLPVNERIPTGRPAALRPYMHAIQRERGNPGPLGREFIHLHLDGMLLEIARAHRLNTAVPAAVLQHRDALLEVRRQMYARLDHPWTVPELAELIDLKRNRFTALYRDCFGLPPHRDLQLARLQEAASRLLTRDESIADIAAICGFANIHYFSRAFREHYRCSPTEFSRRRKLAD